MEQFQDLLSFSWHGTKKGRYTTDKWGDIKNCRKLKDTKTTANALLTGNHQLSEDGKLKLIAFDLDHKDNWEEVIDTFKALHLPQTFTVRSPSGGFHIYYWIPAGVRAKTITDDTHCRNLEVKGDNSNITAPQSRFSDGNEYSVVRDIKVATLDSTQAYRIFKYKQPKEAPRQFWQNSVDLSEVENKAYELDHQAKRRGDRFLLRCHVHNDNRASAVLFDNGYFYCSGCGHEEFIIKKGIRK